jgi:hypothetical protein
MSLNLWVFWRSGHVGRLVYRRRRGSPTVAGTSPAAPAPWICSESTGIPPFTTNPRFRRTPDGIRHPTGHLTRRRRIPRVFRLAAGEGKGHIRSPADSSTEKITVRRVDVVKRCYFVKRTPFDKRGSFQGIWIRNKNFHVPEIRGIRRKRYNEEIFRPETGSFWISHDVKKNPG